MLQIEMGNILAIAIPAIVVLLIVILLMSGYVKASPDRAYIISGWRKKNKILIGRAGIKIPFLEKKDELILEAISIDVKTSSSVPTANYININVDAVANIQVDTSSEGLSKAAKNFLNKSKEYIANHLKELLEGNLREIIGQMTLQNMVDNRKKFSEGVLENVAPDLAEMGIRIISFNVQNFKDDKGIVEDLGIENVSEIKKVASIAKANADKEVAIKQAEADKQANDARVAADLEIAQKQQELQMRKAALKQEADVKEAMADAAYEIEKQNQRKTVEVASANAEIAKAERETELKQQEVEVTQQTLDAQIKKKADADKYALEKQIEAELIRKQKEAEAIRAVGLAEAEAIRQKGLAEAEAMEKKAEAYQKYNNAAIAEMLIKQLPAMTAEIAKPLSSIDNVTIVGGGDGNGVSGIANNSAIVMAQVFEQVKAATGIDLKEIVRADTYEGKTTKNINVTGFEDKNLTPEQVAIISQEVKDDDKTTEL